SAGCGNQVWQCTPRSSAPAHLADPAQTRGERSIGGVTLRQHAETSVVEEIGRDASLWWRIQNPPAVVGEEPIDLGVVLLGLERAGAVDEEPARLHDFGGSAQNRFLQS